MLSIIVISTILQILFMMCGGLSDMLLGGRVVQGLNLLLFKQLLLVSGEIKGGVGLVLTIHFRILQFVLIIIY
jgi:hypothetical protein